jgi:hypothetical protein
MKLIDLQFRLDGELTFRFLFLVSFLDHQSHHQLLNKRPYTSAPIGIWMDILFQLLHNLYSNHLLVHRWYDRIFTNVSCTSSTSKVPSFDF